MKKLVTALIIVLPLVLLIALFAVTGIVRISADIPATGIVINNKGEDGVLFFDIADYNVPLFESDLGIEVLPRIASNRDYTLKITDVNGVDPSNIVVREENGAFSLNGVGIAKLTYTSRDGGYSDSVLFNVTTSGPLSYTPVITDNKGNSYGLEPSSETDYKLTLISGDYALSGIYTPASVVSVSAKFTSSDNRIVNFTDANGHFKAVFGGNAVITMTVDGARGPLVKTVAVNVIPSGDVTIDGCNAVNDTPHIKAPLGVKNVSFGVQSASGLNKDNIEIQGADLQSFSVSPVSGIDGAFNVTLNLATPYTDETSVRYTLSLDGIKYDFYVDYTNRGFGIYSPSTPSGNGDIIIIAGANVRLTVACNPYRADINYAWSISEQENIAIYSSDNDSCVLQANSAGETVLKVTWTEYDGDGNVLSSSTETRTVKSIDGYSSMLFAENADTYGLGGLAIASRCYKDGELAQNVYVSKFKTYGRDGQTSTVENIEFFSSDNSVATVSFDGTNVTICAISDGDVTITAKWKYGDMFCLNPATLTFRAVNGVAVNSDESIRQAFGSGLAAVLTEDIYLGENLFEQTPDGGRKPKYADDVMREKLLQYTGELPTTGDWKYYENLGMSKPTVRYCLDITQNLYGNGHFISAQYITYMLDGTDTSYDFAVFKGPVDFVATNPDGIKLASVKGQDNIVFLARKDGVRIENVVLKGCDDETLYEDGAINLSLLNNMGTTLEIMADVSLNRSRVMNGRTVVRIFGRDGINEKDAVDADLERINANIEGCILQNAREFILKIGTNRIIRGDFKNPDPSLLDADGNEYDAYNSAACDAYVNDEYFMSNYVLTDVTLKDSLLRTSGLFAVGMESHFSGLMLADSVKVLLPFDGWYDLAGTSYPASLRLVGDVVIADWKSIASVDSSTLIETNGAQDSMAFLSLDISAMLKTVQEYGGKKYENLIAKNNGEQFAHGGIAFYGGGKNYSVLDMSEYTFEQMNNYNINLDILTNSSDIMVQKQGLLLPLAAGMHDFRFVMFDANSNFGYDEQTKL